MSSGIKNIVRYEKGEIIQSEPFLNVSINNKIISTQLVGSYNLPNVLAAATIGKHFKVPEEQIKNAL
jgi:UDP-N-acetylmuramoyl-tripeptide--D-alanyl-D-alanine ligase